MKTILFDAESQEEHDETKYNDERWSYGAFCAWM